MNDTKRLVQGAMFVAIYCVFFLVSRFLGGILESLCFFMLPIPLAIFTFLYGWKKALIPYIAIGIVGFLFNPISTIFYVLTANILGIVYGQLRKLGKKESIRLVICIATSTIVNLLTMYVFASLFDYSIQEEISLIFGYILKSLGVNIADEGQMKRLILTSIPTFIFLVGAIEGYLTNFTISFAFKKMKLSDHLPKPIFFLLLPRWFSFIYIVLIFLFGVTFIPFFSTTDIWLIIFGAIFFNAFWISTLIFSLQGIITAMVFSSRKNIKYVFVFLYFVGIIFLTIYFIMVMAIIGFLVVISEYHERLLYNK